MKIFSAKRILAVWILLLPGLAWSQGFSSGSVFSTTHQYGQINVTCPAPGTHDAVGVYCEQNLLLPGTYDNFVGPNVQADTVTVTSDQAKGATNSVSQSVAYSAGQSTQLLNLGTSALFQTPLLGVGTNQLQYSLTLAGVVVSQGTWTVQVNQAATQTCLPATVAGDPDDVCNHPFTSCTTYFQTATCTNVQ